MPWEVCCGPTMFAQNVSKCHTSGAYYTCTPCWRRFCADHHVFRHALYTVLICFSTVMVASALLQNRMINVTVRSPPVSERFCLMCLIFSWVSPQVLPSHTPRKLSESRSLFIGSEGGRLELEFQQGGSGDVWDVHGWDHDTWMCEAGLLVGLVWIAIMTYISTYILTSIDLLL